MHVTVFSCICRCVSSFPFSRIGSKKQRQKHSDQSNMDLGHSWCDFDFDCCGLCFHLPLSETTETQEQVSPLGFSVPYIQGMNKTGQSVSTVEDYFVQSSLNLVRARTLGTCWWVQIKDGWLMSMDVQGFSSLRLCIFILQCLEIEARERIGVVNLKLNEMRNNKSNIFRRNSRCLVKDSSEVSSSCRRRGRVFWEKISGVLDGQPLLFPLTWEKNPRRPNFCSLIHSSLLKPNLAQSPHWNLFRYVYWISIYFLHLVMAEGRSGTRWTGTRWSMWNGINSFHHLT